MSPVHRKRIYVILFMTIGISGAVALILLAFSKNINVFYSPSECTTLQIPQHKTIRLGGMVVKGSVKKETDLQVSFVVTDFKQQISIHYKGILPDLFREGQGVVALGYFNDQHEFIAKEVLAKHDEKYMPPEVAASLKVAGASP